MEARRALSGEVGRERGAGGDGARGGVSGADAVWLACEQSTVNSEGVKMKSEIVGFKMLPIGKLMPHPLADAFPRDAEDQRALDASVGDEGILAPIHVLEEQAEDGAWQVVDGVTRLLAAKMAERGAGSEQKLPCLLVRTNNVEAYVLHLNSARRRVTTGTRVLAYLACHKEQVLQAYEENCDPEATGAMGGRGKKALSRDGAFSAEAIAGRLGVSDKDVNAAIGLLRAKELGLAPEQKYGGDGTPERVLKPGVKADEEVMGKIRAQYLQVLGGVSPVRRWRAALGGAAATAGKARAETNLPDLLLRAATSMRTVFANWAKVEWESVKARECVENRVVDVLATMPEFMRAYLTGTIPTTWSEIELKALRRAIDERLKGGR